MPLDHLRDPQALSEIGANAGGLDFAQMQEFLAGGADARRDRRWSYQSGSGGCE
jgi:hypothetical protein